MGFWGDGSETRNDFQAYVLFLRLILAIQDQYQMLSYYIFLHDLNFPGARNLSYFFMEGFIWRLPTSL